MGQDGLHCGTLDLLGILVIDWVDQEELNVLNVLGEETPHVSVVGTGVQEVYLLVGVGGHVLDIHCLILYLQFLALVGPAESLLALGDHLRDGFHQISQIQDRSIIEILLLIKHDFIFT